MATEDQSKTAHQVAPVAKAAPPPHAPLALVGVGEIHQGLIARISIQRVRDLTLRSDFPKPAAELAEGDVWLLDEVQAWLGEHRAAVAGLLDADCR